LTATGPQEGFLRAQKGWVEGQKVKKAGKKWETENV
jgi:hypothetical protein